MFFRTSRMIQLSSEFSMMEDKRVNVALVQGHTYMMFFFLCKYKWLLNILLNRVSKESINQFSNCTRNSVLISCSQNTYCISHRGCTWGYILIMFVVVYCHVPGPRGFLQKSVFRNKQGHDGDHFPWILQIFIVHTNFCYSPYQQILFVV